MTFSRFLLFCRNLKQWEMEQDTHKGNMDNKKENIIFCWQTMLKLKYSDYTLSVCLYLCLYIYIYTWQTYIKFPQNTNIFSWVEALGKQNSDCILFISPGNLFLLILLFIFNWIASSKLELEAKFHWMLHNHVQGGQGPD